jgi:hypothetical protein
MSKLQQLAARTEATDPARAANLVSKRMSFDVS